MASFAGEIILRRVVLIFMNKFILVWCTPTLASSTRLKEEFNINLPCIELEEDCINQLQTLAVENNSAIADVNQQLEKVKEQIAVARRNNQRAIVWEQLSPFIRFYLEERDVNLPNNRLERSVGNVPFPLRLPNNALSLIGLPFLQNIFGG